MSLITTDRSIAAFIGLAVGDSFGRPLEFLHDQAEVRATPVDVSPGRFAWTDDTHMALYLGEAVLAHGPGPLNDERLGTCIGEAFLRWLDDPLTPHTGPGNTCLQGARAWGRTRDWRTSGVRGSDGCGAVMRVAPLGIAFSGEELDRAATISAMITHAHPNALEGAVATCRLLRMALERGRIDGDLVRELRGGLNPGGTVAAALEAALTQSQAPGDWLDEEAIPDGDGGWRSPSALGLAVTAALKWGEDFATAVEKAARIVGDSDSVAAVAGMLLGAAGGTGAIPAAWQGAVKDGGKIQALAEELNRRGSSI